MTLKPAIFFVALATLPLHAQYTITTLAGSGLPPLPIAGTSLSVTGSLPAVDSAGNLYFANPIIGTVFKLNTAGSVTAVAGTGFSGYSGDGGPATSAQLNGPQGVAIDASGNLYITDSGNNRIRKVSTSGTITTIAGTGSPGSSGDNGPATSATIDEPSGIAVDASGNVYFADSANFKVRKISGGIITTFAGTSQAGSTGDGGPATSAELSDPAGIAVDASGNVYIADSTANRIRKVSGGIIETIAGTGTYGYTGDNGPATSAELSFPRGVAVSAAGTVYIADNQNGRVREIVSGIITTYAGDGSHGYSGDGGPATSAMIGYPQGVAIDSSGNLFVTDLSGHIRKVTAGGTISTVAGNGFFNYSGDGGPATSAQLGNPSAVAVDAGGDVYIADQSNERIRKVSAGTITTFAGTGVAGYSGDNGPAASAQLSNPTGVAVDPTGNVYIADSQNNRIRKVTSSGTITTFAGTGLPGSTGDNGPATSASLYGPSSVASDSVGNIYIADTSNNKVRKVNTSGTITTIAGTGTAGFGGDGGAATSALLNQPRGLAVDANGNVYIADVANDCIREITTDGLIHTVAGIPDSPGFSGDNGPATSAQLNLPPGVAVDPNGDVFIADINNQRIREVSGGIIKTIAGNGTAGYSGNGGPATSAELNQPAGIAYGGVGLLYVADLDNNVVRTLTSCAPSFPASVAGDSVTPTLNVPITIGSSCAWSATNLPSWITGATSGTGSGTLSLTLQSNTTGADRSAVILVNGVSLTVAQAFTAQAFTDVPPGVYYFDAVNLLKAKGITAGCGGTSYCPTAEVSRDQMAIFIVRTIIGSDNFTYQPTPYFGDVPANYFAFPWIQKLYELGVTAGCQSSLPLMFCPTEVVGRDQMAIFITRARYGATTLFPYSTTPIFNDVPSNYYAFSWIQRLSEDSITAGCGNNDYCPLSPVSRGDMAIFVMRGGFNQLLPPTEPIISSISPASIPLGSSNQVITVNGVNTTFNSSSTLVFAAATGITLNSVNVISPTQLQATISSSGSTAPAGPVSIFVETGSQDAVLPNGLTVQ